MEKQKFYYGTRFPARVIQEADDLFSSYKLEKEKSTYRRLTVVVQGDQWSFDSREEFFAEYPKASKFDLMHFLSPADTQKTLWIYSGAKNHNNTSVTVNLATRQQIESIFNVFERNAATGKVIETSKPLTIFIGHGRDPQWRDLKDHLHDKHGMNVVAYEIGPRAGLSVKEVLEQMLADSSFALLVLTAEDIHMDGEAHARENVIHELGLFQGKLGFRRGIAILEEGVKEFSNILGINQIRFSKGNIRETFGDVIATVKREFEHED